jgi:hypothetical protein
MGFEIRSALGGLRIGDLILGAFTAEHAEHAEDLLFVGAHLADLAEWAH